MNEYEEQIAEDSVTIQEDENSKQNINIFIKNDSHSYQNLNVKRVKKYEIDSKLNTSNNKI